jgi:hypothetical protein
MMRKIEIAIGEKNGLYTFLALRERVWQDPAYIKHSLAFVWVLFFSGYLQAASQYVGRT